MIPIRDHNPSERIAYVSWGLIAINVIVFLSYVFLDPATVEAFFQKYALIPSRIVLGEQYEGLLTTMFLHGGWMHLIGNMLFLYIFGDNLEDYFGHFSFLIFYLVGGLAASALHIVVDPTSSIPTVGASGAIAAVMGGYLLLFPKAKVDVLLFVVVFARIFTLPAWIMLLVWLALQIGGGVISLGEQNGGVAYWAHAGGFGAGVVLVGLAMLFGRSPERVDGHPDHPPHKYKRIKTVGPWD